MDFYAFYYRSRCSKLKKSAWSRHVLSALKTKEAFFPKFTHPETKQSRLVLWNLTERQKETERTTFHAWRGRQITPQILSLSWKYKTPGLLSAIFQLPVLLSRMLRRCYSVYLCSRRHQLQLKLVWEATHEPQLENCRHAEKKEKSGVSRKRPLSPLCSTGTLRTGKRKQLHGGRTGDFGRGDGDSVILVDGSPTNIWNMLVK